MYVALFSRNYWILAFKELQSHWCFPFILFQGTFLHSMHFKWHDACMCTHVSNYVEKHPSNWRIVGAFHITWMYTVMHMFTLNDKSLSFYLLFITDVLSNWFWLWSGSWCQIVWLHFAIPLPQTRSRSFSFIFSSLCFSVVFFWIFFFCYCVGVTRRKSSLYPQKVLLWSQSENWIHPLHACTHCA